jgi:hypothetical protein
MRSRQKIKVRKRNLLKSRKKKTKVLMIGKELAGKARKVVILSLMEKTVDLKMTMTMMGQMVV